MMEETAVKNILLIAKSQSYLILSVQEKLQEMGYCIHLVKMEVESITRVKEVIQAIIIYTDSSILENQQGLIYLKDRAVEEDIPIFTIGNTEELETVAKFVPKHLIQKEFVRPINVKELTDAVDAYISTCATESKKKILVVDDSGAMLRSVKEWFEGKYQVILANSGAMAIKYLTLNRPDLVLLDYEMPVCDGRQVLEMMRSESEFDEIPVIFLTSKGDRESVMKVMSLKPDGYLLKTMPPAQIVQSVDEFFVKRKAL